jgi:hypothetical protein
MSMSARLEADAIAPPPRNTKRRARSQPRSAKAPDSRLRPALSPAELAFRVYAALRAHPHVSNVLTHISRARWGEVEQTISSILDPATKSGDLSPLGQNIVDLMVGERGITGKILKPYFHAVLCRLLDPPRSERLIRQIEALFFDLEWKAAHPAPPPASNESAQEPEDV